MARKFTPKVVTANALLAGDVVYLTADNRWSVDLRADEAHAQLRLVEASARHAEVVGVYLADMEPGANGPEPTHFREAFRRTGPSNYAHGKQAEL